MAKKFRTAQQNRNLWAWVHRAATAGGLGREDAEEILRGLVESTTGQRSTRALSVSQAATVLNELERRFPNNHPTRQTRHRVPRDGASTVTLEQLNALAKLQSVLGLSSEGYQAFCRRTVGRPWPQTRGDAVKAYEGLTAMLRRRHSTSYLDQVAVRILDAVASPQDHQFARSIRAAIKQQKKLGAGQIAILLKIGGRYEVLEAISDGGRGG